MPRSTQANPGGIPLAPTTAHQVTKYESMRLHNNPSTGLFSGKFLSHDPKSTTFIEIEYTRRSFKAMAFTYGFKAFASPYFRVLCDDSYYCCFPIKHFYLLLSSFREDGIPHITTCYGAWLARDIRVYFHILHNERTPQPACRYHRVRLAYQATYLGSVAVHAPPRPAIHPRGHTS